MIIEILKRIQKEKHLNDTQFAKSIGIHRVSWWRIKKVNVIGAETLLSAMEVYPEVREAFLTLFDKPHNRNLRGLIGRVVSYVTKGIKGG